MIPIEIISNIFRLPSINGDDKNENICVKTKSLKQGIENAGLAITMITPREDPVDFTNNSFYFENTWYRKKHVLTILFSFFSLAGGSLLYMYINGNFDLI